MLHRIHLCTYLQLSEHHKRRNTLPFLEMKTIKGFTLKQHNVGETLSKWHLAPYQCQRRLQTHHPKQLSWLSFPLGPEHIKWSEFPDCWPTIFGKYCSVQIKCFYPHAKHSWLTDVTRPCTETLLPSSICWQTASDLIMGCKNFFASSTPILVFTSPYSSGQILSVNFLLSITMQNCFWTYYLRQFNFCIRQCSYQPILQLEVCHTHRVPHLKLEASSHKKAHYRALRYNHLSAKLCL